MQPRETKKDNWVVIKWDFITNLLFLGGFLYFQDTTFFRILSYFVFIQIFVFSYYAFTYKGPWVSIFFGIVTTLLFLFVANYPPNWELEFLFRVFAWSFFSYTLFWVLISIKNYILYLRSLRPKICPICGGLDKELVIFLEEGMCHTCFDLGKFVVQVYHGTHLNFWDFEVIDALENELNEEVPLIDIEKLESSTDTIYDIPFGFTVKDQKITNLMLVNKSIGIINLAIGTLSYLEFLNLYNNKIQVIPGSFQELRRINRLDLRRNPVRFNTLELKKTASVIKENGCELLID